MSFNSSKRVIGFVIIALMGGSPLLALTKTSKKKQADTAAVIKAPRLSAKNRTRTSSRTDKQKRARAYNKNVKRKKSSKSAFLTNKKSHKKIASSKSKQVGNKKLSSKRMHNKARLKKAQATRKNTRVATRAQHKQVQPSSLGREPQEVTH